MFSSNGSKTSHFSVLLVADPVDSSVILDGSMSRIDKEDLEEFEGRILSNPIRVKNSKGR